MQSQQPLKINFLVDSIGQAGTYFRFHNLAIGLTKLGHQVTIFAGDGDTNSKARTELRDQIPYHVLPSFPGQRYFSATNHPLNALRRALVDYPACDVAHVFQPFLSAGLPWQFSLKHKAKVRFYDWDDLWLGGVIATDVRPKQFVAKWQKYWISRIEQNFPAQADHVTTCSHFLAERAKQRQAKDVSIIHNGFWGFDVLDKATARKNFGMQPDALYVGFMGRTFASPDWCFEAIANNIERYPQLRFAICGITTEILELMGEWQQVPDEVKARVEMFGHIPSQKTREFSAAIDLGLLNLADTSFNQSRFPIKYAEYMATATPVLCSEVGECAMLSRSFPWVTLAGTTKSEWLVAFDQAVAAIANGTMPKVDLDAIAAQLSWAEISKKLEQAYYQTLSHKSF
ncbi:hypothetical protein Pse7367_3801 (plasmid) [Thalassoporum mexicanum PCC 7367]|uniref:glycosyltransferase n=1 Tax=Thalassoporum mexicanum TaxID=3457544 RepID=UPI00029F909B|nr:glycosyltransferase [Pseudanabaena sp. PCC 7367]AFY72024.1 hypothetical protein Pse7367_3801 [Pseudanabaena sp. PCC 7367]